MSDNGFVIRRSGNEMGEVYIDFVYRDEKDIRKH
jgi:hypothetical protein